MSQSCLASAGELMGQRAKRTTTVTVDLGELKAPWQAGVRPMDSHRAMRCGTPFVRPRVGEPPRPLRLGVVSPRSVNEQPLASN